MPFVHGNAIDILKIKGNFQAFNFQESILQTHRLWYNFLDGAIKKQTVSIVSNRTTSTIACCLSYTI